MLIIFTSPLTIEGFLSGVLLPIGTVTLKLALFLIGPDTVNVLESTRYEEFDAGVVMVADTPFIVPVKSEPSLYTYSP